MDSQNKSNNSGFTLIELMMVLLIIAITLGIGVPSFQGFIQDSRVAGLTNAFVSSLNYTRSEAVKRGSEVSLCKSSNGSSCTTSGHWEQGWIVFVDSSNFGTWDAGEEILRVQEKFDGNTRFQSTTGVGNAFTFLGSGRMTSGHSGEMLLCDAPEARKININTVGRIHLIEATC